MPPAIQRHFSLRPINYSVMFTQISCKTRLRGNGTVESLATVAKDDAELTKIRRLRK